MYLPWGWFERDSGDWKSSDTHLEKYVHVGCGSRDRIGGIEPKKFHIPRELGSWSVAGLSSQLPKFLPSRGIRTPSAAVAR